MDTPLTINEIRHAVDAIADGLLNGKRQPDDAWDTILPVLLASYTQTGGHTRRLFQRLFNATYLDDDGHELKVTLRELQAALPSAKRPTSRATTDRRHRQDDRHGGYIDHAG